MEQWKFKSRLSSKDGDTTNKNCSPSSRDGDTTTTDNKKSNSDSKDGNLSSTGPMPSVQLAPISTDSNNGGKIATMVATRRKTKKKKKGGGGEARVGVSKVGFIDYVAYEIVLAERFPLPMFLIKASL